MPKTTHFAPETCTLCPRQCRADRAAGRVGFCGAGGALKAARAALHFWEEPCISGTRGSGTVFFSGCTLKCCFCQNYPISAEGLGKEISVGHLAEIFLDLQAQGAHNINLVTPGQWQPWIIAALDLARAQGLHLPIVCNTGGYETRQGDLRRASGRDLSGPAGTGRAQHQSGHARPVAAVDYRGARPGAGAGAAPPHRLQHRRL